VAATIVASTFALVPICHRLPFDEDTMADPDLFSAKVRSRN
jgi:hypothetical protein